MTNTQTLLRSCARKRAARHTNPRLVLAATLALAAYGRRPPCQTRMTARPPTRRPRPPSPLFERWASAGYVVLSLASNVCDKCTPGDWTLESKHLETFEK